MTSCNLAHTREMQWRPMILFIAANSVAYNLHSRPITTIQHPPQPPITAASPPLLASRRAVRVRMAEEDDADEEGGALGPPINRFVEAIQNMTAPDLIRGFAETAPAEVQAAVRQTVVSLLGNLPPNVYDVNVASTGQNIASLMYSMQMTGYMFRNAEYRRSLLNTLESTSPLLDTSVSDDDDDDDDDEEAASSPRPQISGKIKVKLSDSKETEVEASAYMAELRNEVRVLRSQLGKVKEVHARCSCSHAHHLLFLVFNIRLMMSLPFSLCCHRTRSR